MGRDPPDGTPGFRFCVGAPVLIRALYNTCRRKFQTLSATFGTSRTLPYFVSDTISRLDRGAAGLL
jgi:hypothetical protein